MNDNNNDTLHTTPVIGGALAYTGHGDITDNHGNSINGHTIKCEVDGKIKELHLKDREFSSVMNEITNLTRFDSIAAVTGEISAPNGSPLQKKCSQEFGRE